MKRKFFTLMILIGICFNLTGCFDSNNLEGSRITSTVYPIEYLVNRLYGEDSKINSIYPDNTKINDYELTDKQINTFSKNTDVFVYNGLTNEKEIARTLINKNKSIQIVDVSYGLKYSYGVSELWLNPNNYLMLATTIKSDLEEISNNKYEAETIEKNYKKLEEDLSILDAQIKRIADSAISRGSSTLIVADDSFKFLESYGFTVISIANENDITNTIKAKFKDKEYKFVFVSDEIQLQDAVKDLVDNYEATIVSVNVMSTLTDEERNNNDNYLTIMNEFVTQLSNVVLS